MAAAACDELVDESALARLGIDACQVRVRVHAPGQELLFWGEQCHVAEVPAIICKRHMDFQTWSQTVVRNVKILSISICKQTEKEASTTKDM